MIPITYSLIAAFIIMLASLSGILFTSKHMGGWVERNLSLLATFSIGIFAVITWGLCSEALEHGDGFIVAISLVLGVGIVKILSTLIPEAHHHHDHHTDHSHDRIDARRIIMGDSVHNIGDGLLLVPAFIADTRLGIATAAGILIHELVQEISEYFILRESGYSVKEALIRNFISSTTILIGVLLSAILSSIEILEVPLMGIAAGGFLYIILKDLVPHTISSIRKKGKGEKHVQALVFGILIMLGVNIVLPHSHEEAHVPETELNHVEN